MNIFYLLIGVSLFVALIFLGAFIWAVRNGQFDDNETPSMRVLFDDDSTDTETNDETQPEEQKQTT